MSNLDLWNKLKQPPKDALKKITGGRLSGMTDIKPQWRIQAITEQFGPCGIGWKYRIDKVWAEQENKETGEVAVFAIVIFNYRQDDKWSEDIHGIGGHTLFAKEKSGLHTNDECYKMAVTDALSVAFKAIGVAADIYLGNWDGSKYINNSQDHTEVTTADKVDPKVSIGSDILTRLRESNLSDDKKAEYEREYRSKPTPEIKKSYEVFLNDEINKSGNQIPLM